MPHNRASCHAELAEVSQHTVQLPVGSVRQYWNKSRLPQIEVIRNNHCKIRTFSESTRGKNCSPQSSSSNDRSPFHIQWLCFKIYFSQRKRNETSEAFSSMSTARLVYLATPPRLVYRSKKKKKPHFFVHHCIYVPSVVIRGAQCVLCALFL